MALAYIQVEEVGDRSISFHADTGSNRYYRYKVGKSRSSLGGLEQVDETVYASPMEERPEGTAFSTAFRLEIPREVFGGENRLLQFYSFADREGKGPAISKIIEVYYPELDKNPLLAQSLSEGIIKKEMKASPFNPCRSSAFAFQENRLSQGLFLEALLQIAGGLAPQIGHVVAGLLNQGGGGNTASSDSILRVINAIVAALPRSSNGASAAGAAPAGGTPGGGSSSTQQSRGLSRRNTAWWEPRFQPDRRKVFYTPLSRNRRWEGAQKPFARGMIVDGGLLTGPLLASAIGPLLQSAPQLIQAVGDLPLRLMALRSQERMQRQQADQDYILRLLNGIQQETNMQELLRLLAAQPQTGMGAPAVAASFSTRSASPGFQAILKKAHPLQVNGKPKFVYYQPRDVTFLLELRTDKTPPDRGIPRAVVHLAIKHPDTLNVLTEKTFRFEDVKLGTALGLTLTASELANLPSQTDLFVCTEFRWRGRDGKPQSLKDTHLCFLVKGAWMKQVNGVSGQETPLLDPAEYSVFWNKIWESPAAGSKRWQAEFEAKYYLHYQPYKTENARVETRIKMDTDASGSSERREAISGRLKSALEVSPVELNKLLPRLGGGAELPPEKLEAFRSDELRRHFNLQATANIAFKGKRGERGSLWTFPEVSLRRFALSLIAQTEPTGQVVSVAEEEVEFPMPTSLHFVGAVTN